MCDKFKSSRMREFDMSDLRRMKYFLGIKVIQNEAGIFICQRRYAREVLKRFGMENSNYVKNPIVPRTRLSKDETRDEVEATMFKQAVGSLMYLTTYTYITNTPKEIHPLSPYHMVTTMSTVFYVFW